MGKHHRSSIDETVRVRTMHYGVVGGPGVVRFQSEQVDRVCLDAAISTHAEMSAEI